MTPGSPYTELKVRQALNLAVDRDGLVKLLNGTAQPGLGLVYPGHPWFGVPQFKVRYDPAEAKRRRETEERQHEIEKHVGIRVERPIDHGVDDAPQHRHADPGAAQFVGESLAEAQYIGLAGEIDRHARAGLIAGDRGDQHHFATPARDHPGQ